MHDVSHVDLSTLLYGREDGKSKEHSIELQLGKVQLISVNHGLGVKHLVNVDSGNETSGESARHSEERVPS